MDLHNDTVINVAALLKEPFGAWRAYGLTLDTFALDPGLTSEGIEGSVRLTRLAEDVMASIAVAGAVELDCQRCLTRYHQPFEVEFDEQFRATVNVRTGTSLRGGDEDAVERFPIDENHELDFAEPLRQEILVSLPMRPVCGEECPGPAVLLADAEIEDPSGDERFAALQALLDDESSEKG